MKKFHRVGNPIKKPWVPGRCPFSSSVGGTYKTGPQELNVIHEEEYFG